MVDLSIVFSMFTRPGTQQIPRKLTPKDDGNPIPGLGDQHCCRGAAARGGPPLRRRWKNAGDRRLPPLGKWGKSPVKPKPWEIRWIHYKNEKSLFFYRKIHYKWPFSIAMLVITRGYAHFFFGNETWHQEIRSVTSSDGGISPVFF